MREPSQFEYGFYGRPATLLHLRQTVQAQVRKLGKTFRHPDDDWPPMTMFVQSKSHGVELAHIPGHLLEYGDQKNVVAQTLKEAMHVYDGGVIRFALLVNAHGIQFDKDASGSEEVMARLQHEEMRVQDLPGAVEYLWLILGDAETEEHWQCQIQRDERRPPTLTPWRNMAEWMAEEGGGTLSGRFAGLNEALR